MYSESEPHVARQLHRLSDQKYKKAWAGQYVLLTVGWGTREEKTLQQAKRHQP